MYIGFGAVLTIIVVLILLHIIGVF